MSPAPRPKSLFWTFAGVFVLVLVAATALQIFLSLVVVRPLVLASARAAASLAMARAEADLTAQEYLDDATIARTLMANRVENGSAVLAYFLPEGRFVPERPLPPQMPRQIIELAGRAGIVDPNWRPPPPGPGGGVGPPRNEWGPSGGGPPAGMGPPNGMHPPGDPPPGVGSQDGAPPPGPGPPPDGMGPRDGAGPPGSYNAPPLAPGNRRLVLLGIRRMERDGALVGTLVAVGTAEAAGLWESPESRALLLFMPIAILAAAAAGLLMVRILARRIQALDVVAARVTEGDLGARVERTGSDEIGRLEERFNRMTERLAAARDQVAQTDLQRRQLFADITHELATPLTSIRGYVETLLDPNVPVSAEERATYLNDVLEEAKRLDLLTRDLLDLVRLEAGSQPLARVRLDWMALCRNVARRLEPRFREAALTLEWIGPSEESWIDADGRRMEQVIENLLTNALRYVPQGGKVELQITRAADRFRLTVRDDGPGIAPEDLPHVFERFYRARNARDENGSGLGLAITREIVQRHGGDVHAEAASSTGACFVVEMLAADQ